MMYLNNDIDAHDVSVQEPNLRACDDVIVHSRIGRPIKRPHKLDL